MADPVFSDKVVVIIPGGVIFDNANSPREVQIGAFDIPKGDGNQNNFPVTYDNTGKNATIATVDTLPTRTMIGDQSQANAPYTQAVCYQPAPDGKGLPVGTANAADNPVGFETSGKDVVVVPGKVTFTNANGAIETSTYSTPVNYGG